MSRLDTVLVKTASRCNLDCSYCYVYRGKDTSWMSQPKRMSPRVASRVAEQLIEQASRQDCGFAIVLHGGEPLLVDFPVLDSLLSTLRKALAPDQFPISLQSNGILLTRRHLDLFARTRTSVSISLDGPRAANDIARLTHRGDSSFEATRAGVELLLDHPDREFLFAGTLSVIQPEVPAATVYQFLKDLGSPSLDFLLQDGNHDQLPKGKATFTSTEYGRWLVELMDVYLADPAPVPIRVLDDTLKLCLGGTSQKEGRGVEPYGILIVEADGSIRKNDTLRTAFDGADQFQTTWSIMNDEIAGVLESPEFTAYAAGQLPTARECRGCEFLRVCGGGMPLYRWSHERRFDNPSVYCHDHQTLIRHALRVVTEYAATNPELDAGAR